MTQAIKKNVTPERMLIAYLLLASLFCFAYGLHFWIASDTPQTMVSVAHSVMA